MKIIETGSVRFIATILRSTVHWSTLLTLVLVSLALPALAAEFTEFDSTQPRGATPCTPATPHTDPALFVPGPPGDCTNDDGQVLDPIVDGFRAPARFGGEPLPVEEPNHFFYHEWAGSMMAWSMRDPSFFAALNVANQDFIDFVNSLTGEPDEPGSALGKFLAANKLEDDVFRAAGGSLQPEHLLPIAADFCLRCHAPAGWLEAHSEPPTSHGPHLAGDFWGGAMREGPGGPSESEMDGVQCDFCHRAIDNYKRRSLFNGATLARGNSGFFVEVDNRFGPDGVPKPNRFQKTGDFCGTCHDVTNPFIRTVTQVNGVVPTNENGDPILHPIERTYTEWYWSDFRAEKGCQKCHKPMKFQGAQTWLLYPGMDDLWGDIDQQWVDLGFPVPASRAAALQDAVKRNRGFMRKKAAKVSFVDSPHKASLGDMITVKVRIENLAGHKLPTGYAEGRQMWIHVEARNKKRQLCFEAGALNADGEPEDTTVYKQRARAVGYPFLADGEHHFVLLNEIVSDNRIPPKGFVKAAYQADGAFILPEDRYADGQNWDVTAFDIPIPGACGSVKKKLRVTATLMYQTFNREYVDFLRDKDLEPTIANGGRARDIPAGAYGGLEHWGEVTHAIWEDNDDGRPVEMGKAKLDIEIKR